MIPPGVTIDGRYEVESLLGEGGLAHVYRVRHLELGSRHALKLLQFRNQGLADRLLLEGRIQAQLRHPNVVAVTDVIRHDGQFGLLMEYVDHFSLEELIARQGPLAPDVALDLFAPILAGVHAAHRAGVLHRDLKPANVLLARTPQGLVPKVSDFGIAKVISEGLDGSTRDGVAMGTPGYMAPEQILDARSVDARTDIFALGSILYELLTGRRAFADDTGEVSVRATLRTTIPPVAEIVEGVPRSLSDAIDRALAKEREERFPDVLEFAHAVLSTRPSLLALVESTAGAAAPTLTPDLLGLRAPSVEVMAARSRGPTLAPGPPSSAAADPVTSPDAVEPRRRSRAGLWVLVGAGGAGALVLAAVVTVAVLLASADAPQRSESLASPAADGGSGTIASAELQLPAVPSSDAEPAAAAAVEGTSESRPESSSIEAGEPSAQVSDRAVAAGAPIEASEGAPARPVAIQGPAADGGSSAVESASSEPAREPQGVADSDGQAVEVASQVGTAADEPRVTPTVDPTPAAAAQAPAWLAGSTYEGKLFRQPFTLRVTREQGGEIAAEGRVIQGVSQRLVALSGSYDPATGVVSLREVNGDLQIDGVLSRGELRGTYRRKARGEPELLELVRR